MMNKYAYDANPVGVKTHSVGVRSALGRPLVGGWSGWVNRARSRADACAAADCLRTHTKTHKEAGGLHLLAAVVPV